MGINMDMPINTASLTITPQMLSLIAEIDEFKGAWRALGTLGLAPVWFRSLVYHYATLASKAKGLMPPRYEWRLRGL